MKLSSPILCRLPAMLAVSIAIATMGTANSVAKADANGSTASQNSPKTSTVKPALQFAVTLPDARFDSEHPAKFDLPALPARAGLKPVLRLRMVVQTPASTGTSAGFNYNASVVVNGTALQRLTNRNEERLLMRPPVFKLLSTGNS